MDPQSQNIPLRLRYVYGVFPLRSTRISSISVAGVWSILRSY